MDTSDTISPLASLTSDPEDKRCYCGKPRDMRVELQCGMCSRFYHQNCIESHTGDIVPFMTNYQFFCKRCNASGSDMFNKKAASFGQMCMTALANLSARQLDEQYFSKDNEIIPWIEKYWEHMTTAPRKAKQSWHATIHKTMLKDPDIFSVGEEVPGDMMFGLANPDLLRIGPNCEALFKLVGTTTDAKTDVKSSSKVSSDTKARGTKRKTAGDGPTVDQRRAKKGETNLTAKIVPTGYPSEHPFNKDGYRYILAEPDPHAPNWEAFDQSMEWAGKPIPGYLYRTWLQDTVELALHDRAPQLKVSDDHMTVTGEKGYSMIRATHGVNRGNWYFEVSVRDMPQDSAVRLGWSQSLGNLQAPCGYDKFSYSWRSKKGTIFHQSRGKHYSAKGFGEKDVLGFFISLPMSKDGSKLVPSVYKDKPLVKFKNLLYYEEKDEVQETEKNLKPFPGSKIIMYRNGRNQGVAFEDLFQGKYFPAISIYKNATVSINFGPKFRHQPRDQDSWQPMCEATGEAYVDHALGDILYHIDNEGKLPEF